MRKIPKPKKHIWVLFDLSNGDDTHRYVWWFESRGKARAYADYHYGLKHSAKLSQPIKYSRA